MPMENKVRKSNLPRGLTKGDAVKSLAQRYIERAYKNLELMKRKVYICYE